MHDDRSVHEGHRALFLGPCFQLNRHPASILLILGVSTTMGQSA